MPRGLDEQLEHIGLLALLLLLDAVIFGIELGGILLNFGGGVEYAQDKDSGTCVE